MKKVLSVFLIVSLMLSSGVTAVATGSGTEKIGDYLYYDGDYGPFNYSIENGEVTITFCDINASGAIEIPEEIEGYPVKHIGGGAFTYRQSVTSVTIPDSIETIGDSAFYFTNIQSIYLPDSIRSIEPFAFEQCDAVINLDHKVLIRYTLEGEASSRSYVLTYFGNHLIRNTSDGKCTLEIPEGTLCIAGEAIISKNFKAVNIPASVVNIGDRAFVNCESNEAFTVSEDNLYYSADEHGVLYNKDKTVLISYPRANTATNFTVPETVKEIEPYAFNNCTNLMSVTMNEGVESIGEYAFYGCTSLVDIELPDSLRKIEFNAFEETGYYLDANNWKNSILYIGKHLIKYDPNNHPSDEIDTEIKDGTISIAEIGLDSFPNPLSIPESVRELSEGAFMYSNAPETITISKYVEHIGDRTFYGTETVKRFEVDGNNPYYSNDEYGVLFNKDKTVLIDYPEASELTEYTIPASVEEIAVYAFSGCQNLKYFDFKEDSVMTMLNDSAFYDCTSLESVNLPENLFEIKSFAFGNCTNLKTISIPENVMKIGAYAFTHCETLETVDFSKNSKLRYLGSGTFENCRVLKEIEIPEGVKKLRDSLFRFCYKLESVTIKAADLVSIENDVFHYNNTLNAVIFYGTEEQWANVQISGTRNASLKQKYVVCDPENNGFTYTFIFKNKEYIRKFKYGEPVVIPEGIDIYAVRSWSGDPIPETMPRKNLTSTALTKLTSESDNYDATAYYLSGTFTTRDVSLSVEEIQGDREPGGIYMVDGEYYKQVGLYNIKTVNENGEVVQPNNGYKVTIRLAIPEAYKNNKSFMIYHRFTGGGREQLSTENGTLRVENGYLVFEVTKFSEFEIFVPSARIKITQLPYKTVYNYNTDEIDLTGIRIKYTKADGTTKILSDSSALTVTGFDGTKVGEQTVTVKYGQYSDTFEVTVKYNWWQWIIYVLFLGFLKI